MTERKTLIWGRDEKEVFGGKREKERDVTHKSKGVARNQ